MAQVCSDPRRENESTALPDVEVFYTGTAGEWADLELGWYWQVCFPGCLPDGEPNGPFTTEQDAITDAQCSELNKPF